MELILPDGQILEKNGPLRTAFYYLRMKEADGIVFGLQPARIYGEGLDAMTFPSASVPHGLAVPKPGEESRLWAFLRPFQMEVTCLKSHLINLQSCVFNRCYRFG